jgi:hypothetical protein
LVTALVYPLNQLILLMTSKRIANLVLALGLLSFGAASCDIFDPYDPGNGGGGNGGGCGGGDTIIVDDSSEMVQSTGVLHIVMSATNEPFVGLDAADGQRYEPTNLFPQDIEEGMRVKFTGQVLGDWGSINQYGKLIEIHELEKID